MAGLSERSLAKARRLGEAGNVREVTPARTFVVQGDHDTYTVTVTAAGATCTCPVYGECSHREAAILSLCEPEPARPSDRDAGGRPRLSTCIQPRSHVRRSCFLDTPT